MSFISHFRNHQRINYTTVSSINQIQKTKIWFVNFVRSKSIFKVPEKPPRPKASEVLTNYIKQSKEPHWTSYFVKYSDVLDDQWGKSHFNWQVGKSNYHILRTGCFPYIKYHCTRRNKQNLIVEDYFFRCIKVINLGIPCLVYGIAAKYLIRHTEIVSTSCGKINIYFLYPEDKGYHY